MLIKKILDLSALVIATVLNTKIWEVESRLSYTSGLVTTIVLNTKITEVENKKPNARGLVKKETYYSPKISDIEKKILLRFVKKYDLKNLQH